MIAHTVKKLSILTLLLGFTLAISACENDNGGSDENYEALSDQVDAFTNGESYTMDFTMKAKNSDRTIDIVNKVENRKEYVSFSGEEYYQQFNAGTMVRYFKDENTGAWDKRVIQLEDEPAKSFISPDNINMDWFREGDGNYYVLKSEHIVDMFGEDNENTIDIATIRVIDEGLEVAYSFRTQIESTQVTFDYKAIIHSVNETSVSLPEVSAE